MVYSTSKVIDLISKDKDLMFECFSGIHEGKVISFNEYKREIVLNDCSRVNLTEEFLCCSWKILQPVKEKIFSNPIRYLFASAEIPLTI